MYMYYDKSCVFKSACNIEQIMAHVHVHVHMHMCIARLAHGHQDNADRLASHLPWNREKTGKKRYEIFFSRAVVCALRAVLIVRVRARS